MLTTVPMVKVALVGPKGSLRPTIETLHAGRLLHVDDYTPGDDTAFDLGTPLPEGEAVSERLLRLRSVIKNAQIATKGPFQPFTEENLGGLEGRLREVEDELARLVESRGNELDAVKALDDEAQILARVANLPLPLQDATGFRSLAVISGFVPLEADLKALTAVDPHLETIESNEAEGRFVVVFTRAANQRAVLERLAQLKYTPLELPEGEGRPAERLADIREERKVHEGRITELNDKIEAIKERHTTALLALDERLTIEADQTTAPVRFRTTKNAFVVEGWVPADRFDRLEADLLKATRNQVYVTKLETPSHAAHAHESEHHAGEAAENTDPPVKMYNKGRAGFYELLTDTFSRPKYREIDPTLFLFLGFPFFYGFMLGDIGYALVLIVLIKTGVFNKVFDLLGFESKRHLNRILFHSFVWSFIFGIIYSEFFGLELFGHHGVLYGDHGMLGAHSDLPLLGHAAWYPVARFIYVPQLLIATVLIGNIHLLVGLLLGFRNAKAAHGLKDAFTHRGSWIGILLGIDVVALAFMPFGGIPAYQNIILGAGVALFALGLILLLKGEGAIGIMEIPTIMSNLLSYTRLVAIGLSSAGIALAGNKVSAQAMAAGGVGGILAGILVLLVFHTINIGLGVLGPALHSLRLHYVEFFTKFYEGGGTPYKPFGIERKYTKKEVKTA